MSGSKKILVCGLNIYARHWVELFLSRGCEVTWAPTDSDLKTNPNELVILSSPTFVEGPQALARAIPLFYKERLIERFGASQDLPMSNGRFPTAWIDRIRALALHGDIGPRLQKPLYGDALIENLKGPSSLQFAPQFDTYRIVPRRTLNRWSLDSLRSQGLKTLKADQCVLSFSLPSSSQVTAIYNAPFGQESFDGAYWASRTASLRIEGSDRKTSDKEMLFSFSARGAWVDSKEISSLPPAVFEVANNEAGAYFVDTGQWTSGAFNRLLVMRGDEQSWIQMDTLKVEGESFEEDPKIKPFVDTFPQFKNVVELLKPLDLCDERVIDANPETKITSVGAKLKILKTSNLTVPSNIQTQMMAQELGL